MRVPLPDAPCYYSISARKCKTPKKREKSADPNGLRLPFAPCEEGIRGFVWSVAAFLPAGSAQLLGRTANGGLAMRAARVHLVDQFNEDAHAVQFPPSFVFPCDYHNRLAHRIQDAKPTKHNQKLLTNCARGRGQQDWINKAAKSVEFTMCPGTFSRNDRLRRSPRSRSRCWDSRYSARAACPFGAARAGARGADSPAGRCPARSPDRPRPRPAGGGCSPKRRGR